MTKRGGARQKMNLDLTPEEFNKLSLRQANEILDRLAKRYNQRIKTFYKADPYHALKIYSVNGAEVGTSVFSRKKAKNVNEARERFKALYNYSQSKHASITTYRAYQREAVKQLAVNVGLISDKESDEMSESDMNNLSGFFDYIYTDLKIDKDEYNYKDLTDFFSTYKLTEKESADRLEKIKEAWRKFKTTGNTLDEELSNQREAMIKAGIIKKGDRRPISEIYRERMEKEKEE